MNIYIYYIFDKLLYCYRMVFKFIIYIEIILLNRLKIIVFLFIGGIKMKWLLVGIFVVLSLGIIGCGQSEVTSENSSLPNDMNKKSTKTIEFKDIDDKTAFLIALDDASVPQDNAYNIKIEKDEDGNIPIYDIEFETNYGDYDYEIAIEDGSIIGADYEVDENWFDRLGGSPVTIDEAKQIVHERVLNAPIDTIEIWKKSSNGRDYYEGKLSFNNIKYEFEIDSATGIIYDWNADLE